MIWGWLQKLRHVGIDWFRYYIVFSKAASFIFGLVFSHSLIEYAVTGNIMSYLSEIWKTEHVSTAVIIVNVVDGLSTVMVIVVAHVSDAYSGHFKMIVFSTLASIFGLELLLLTVLDMRTWTVYLAMILIALGKAGRDVPIKAFLCDQLRQHEPSTGIDEERVEARRRVWWRFPWFSGAAVASFGISADASWAYKFTLSTIVMAVAFLLFHSGLTFYHCQKPTGSPLTTVFRVFKAAIINWRLDYPRMPNQFFKNDTDQYELLPHISWLRWLDKAAIVECSSSTSPKEQENRGHVCTVKQVREVKILLKMVPMWITLLAYSLVQATGSTFFIEQASYMDGNISIGFTIPVVTFFLITVSFSAFIISFVCDLLIPKIWSEANQQCAARVRIACGLACSVLCCITAWSVEFRRLHDETMSVLWLTPQFCLLGLMGGLAGEGLGVFFYNHVAESMRRYGPVFRDCILGIGKFLSIPCLLIFRSWFKDSLNRSHLDWYYIMLATASFGNLCFYLYVSNKYYNEEAPVEKVDLPDNYNEEAPVEVVDLPDALLEEVVTNLTKSLSRTSSKRRSIRPE